MIRFDFLFVQLDIKSLYFSTANGNNYPVYHRFSDGHLNIMEAWLILQARMLIQQN